MNTLTKKQQPKESSNRAAQNWPKLSNAHPASFENSTLHPVMQHVIQCHKVNLVYIT
jgi:hypothetical protein